MLTVQDAVALVLEHADPLLPVTVNLLEGRGRLLAEDVRADADQPPFDRSLVDGFAVRAADLDQGRAVLRITQTVVAGQTRISPVAAGEAAAIMTGAPLPPGADAVVMQERTRRLADELLVECEVVAGLNIQPRGRVYGQGALVLSAGSVLTPACIGLLASVGHCRVRVIPGPRVAIVPTGDELVEPHETPGPGQIRNSNAAMLAAMVLDQGAAAEVYPIARDDPSALRETLGKGLEHDVLIVTGGVSVGHRDLVPAALAELIVCQVFHKVRVKPGKPVWFGVAPRRSEHPGTLVFGLPGNPLSGLVGYLLFVRPALQLLAGKPATGDESVPVRLDAGFKQRGDRATCHPARRVGRPGNASEMDRVETLEFAGSADVLTVTRADGFVMTPPGDRVFHAGEIVRFLPLR